MLDALRIVIKLKKVKADDLKVRQDNRAPIVGPSSITPWMMFSRVGWLKNHFFLMLRIAKLRSIQYQDADNRISDPTDSKTSLQSDLYHAGHGSQALVRRYLQRLLSANPKGSHALLIAHPPIMLCSFALHAIQTMRIGS